MYLLTHAHIRIALFAAIGVTLLFSTRLSPSHLPLTSSYYSDEQATQIVVEPIQTNSALTVNRPTNADRPNEQVPTETASEQTALFVVGSAIANLRSEPRIDAPVGLVANQGQQFTIIGKSPDLEWIAVRSSDGSRVWIASQLGVIYGSLEQTPFVPFVMTTGTHK